MDVTDFTTEHIPAANALALACYEEERSHVAALPDPGAFPDLTAFAGNGLGAAAFLDGALVGFLCSTTPFRNAFGSTGVRGVFSPMGANAARAQNRAAIWAALYQYAALKWVRAGAVSHGICLYAHDEAAQQQFFQYGFGLRCVDAIRTTERICVAAPEGYTFAELAPADFALVYPLKVMLHQHYLDSPFFMNREPSSLKTFCETCVREGERCFAAFFQNKLCAYLKLSETGETFLTQASSYRHINSAFCRKEYRGTGVYGALLAHVNTVLNSEGFTHLGVDFESINPAAYGFWRKQFTPYTHGVVRRVDERSLDAIRS